MSGDYSARDLVTIPGLLSLARLPLAVAFPLTLEHRGWAVVVLAMAASTDVMDGWYARRFHQTTPMGALLDGIMDKVFVSAVVVTMLASGGISVVEALLMGTRDLGEAALVLYGLAVWRVRKPMRRSANRAGKLATVMQFSTIVALLWGTSHRGAWMLVTAACGAIAAATYAVKEWRAHAGETSPDR